jgi:hypothetical protein
MLVRVVIRGAQDINRVVIGRALRLLIDILKRR